MKKIRQDDNAAVELLFYVLTIIVVGALYSLFFITIAYPAFKPMIPDSDTKTFIMMLMYALPGIILITGVIAVIREGIKRNIPGGRW